MCQHLTRDIKEQDRIAGIMFSTLTRETINNLGLGYKECAMKNLNEALNIYKNMNDEFIYKRQRRLFILWKNYIKIGFSEGAELIKESLIESKSIKIDHLGNKASFFTSLGWFLLLMKEYAQAQQPLEDALKAEQKLKRSEIKINNAKNKLARLYIYTEKYDKAESLLNEALSVFEKMSAKDKSTLHNYAESQNYLGRLRMKQKRYAEAENFFELSLENYKKAAKLDKLWEEDAKETSLLLEQVKSLQED
jgi:tetratricopeptide (TPR) repeat protein